MEQTFPEGWASQPGIVHLNGMPLSATCSQPYCVVVKPLDDHPEFVDIIRLLFTTRLWIDVNRARAWTRSVLRFPIDNWFAWQ
jgi:hypothetical protein